MLIGEVSEHAGISTRMLRHYDSIGLIRPRGRTTGGYRDYSSADLRRLFQVESLRSLGLSLVEVKRALDDPAFVPVDLVDELIAATQQRIAREQSLLNRFEQLRASEPTSWTDVLHIVAMLRGLSSAEPSRRLEVALTIDEKPVPAISLAQALLDEPDPNVAGALQWALVRSGNDSLPALEAALDAPDPATRQRAVAAISEIGTVEAQAALARLLDSSDDDLRGRAALAMGADGAVAAVPELLRMIVQGTDDAAAADVLAALARQRHMSDRIAAMLEDELRRPERSSAERFRVTQALVDVQGSVAHRAMVALVDDPDPTVRLIAAYYLHRYAQEPQESPPESDAATLTE